MAAPPSARVLRGCCARQSGPVVERRPSAPPGCDPRAGRIRVEHWVVAQRQGQTAARNILGARERLEAPPFFWSNHFDLHIRYVGHGSGDDEVNVSGDLKAKDASVIFRSRGKTTAVASMGRDLESLKAELALERDDEFHVL